MLTFTSTPKRIIPGLVVACWKQKKQKIHDKKTPSRVDFYILIPSSPRGHGSPSCHEPSGLQRSTCQSPCSVADVSIGISSILPHLAHFCGDLKLLVARRRGIVFGVDLCHLKLGLIDRLDQSVFSASFAWAFSLASFAALAAFSAAFLQGYCSFPSSCSWSFRPSRPFFSIQGQSDSF